MDLLAKELQKTFCTHLILPIFQLAEVIAHEVLESKSLSDLYRLRFVLVIFFSKMGVMQSLGLEIRIIPTLNYGFLSFLWL